MLLTFNIPHLLPLAQEVKSFVKALLYFILYDFKNQIICLKLILLTLT